jgi:hypothetical protein
LIARIVTKTHQIQLFISSIMRPTFSPLKIY